MSRQQTITDALNQAFNPISLQVLDESHQHSVPVGSESHFKVILISNTFESLSRVKRHQAVFECLKQELDSGLHALSLHLYTETEWGSQSNPPAESPLCRGGEKISS